MKPTAAGASPETAAAPQPGALLSDAQIALLRRAVIIMTTLLVAGVILLIGRIIYLARGPQTQAATAVSAGLAQPPLLPTVQLMLPAGADIKQMTMAGSRLVIHHTQSGADGVTVLDLATGGVVSRVTIERGK